MKRAVIFDMDGVLVDNSQIHVDAFVVFCKRHGVDMERDALKPFFGMGNDDIIPGVLGRAFSKSEIELLAEEKEVIYRELFAKQIKPQKGLVDLLEALKDRGIKMAVASSAMQKNVDFVLDSCGIREYFSAVSNGDMIKHAKPDPEVFLLAASLLDEKPEDCVVFEDAFVGIKAARSAGMKVIALTTTYPKEQHKDFDAIIDDFTQITILEVLK